MKKRSVRKGTRLVDAVVREFESKDLGHDLRASGVKPVAVRPKTRMTSILLEERLIDELRRAGAKRGLGYQTMLKVIVREHIAKY